ncbi:beta-carotene 15,15'-monooxygenase [Streptococcus suis]
MDVINYIGIFFLLSKSKTIAIIKINTSNLSIIIFLAFILYAAVSFFWGNMDFYHAISRYRYILGAFIYYLLVHNNLSNKTYYYILRCLFVIQTINFILVVYQNLIMRVHPDFSNGIFGFTGYANGIAGSFCLALSLLAVVYYLTGKWKLIKSVYLLGISSLICAISEIKIYFIVFIICSIFIIFFQKRNLKETFRFLVMFIGIVILFFISYQVIKMILPDNLGTFFSVNKSLSYEQRTTYAGRTNTIPFILENTFHNEIISSVFGGGLGSYSQDYIYELGKTFSDFGFIGVCLLYSFLLLNTLKPLKIGRISDEELFVSSFSLGMMISIVVWNAFFTQTTYIVFFFLGISSVSYYAEKE